MKKYIALIAVVLLAGCTTLQKQQLAATGSQLSADALAVARRTVDAFATSELDAVVKNGFTQSSGDLLRSLENSAIASSATQLATTLPKQLDTWLPDKSHWQNYADQISKVITNYVTAHPNVKIDTVLEVVATTLQNKPPATVPPKA